MSGLTQQVHTRIVRADGREEAGTCTVLRERELLVVTPGTQLGLLTCTDTDLERLVLGWLYTQRILNAPSELLSLDLRDEFAVVKLDGPLRPPAERRKLRRLTHCPHWTSEDVFALAARFREGMPLHRATGATHSCLLMREGEILYTSEDVGRFNAVDKAVGFALEQGIPLRECLIYSSGRVSEELVRKMAAAEVAVLISKAIPTAQAVERAQALGVTLICRAWEDSFTQCTFPTAPAGESEAFEC